MPKKKRKTGTAAWTSSTPVPWSVPTPILSDVLSYLPYRCLMGRKSAMAVNRQWCAAGESAAMTVVEDFQTTRHDDSAKRAIRRFRNVVKVELHSWPSVERCLDGLRGRRRLRTLSFYCFQTVTPPHIDGRVFSLLIDLPVLCVFNCTDDMALVGWNGMLEAPFLIRPGARFNNRMAGDCTRCGHRRFVHHPSCQFPACSRKDELLCYDCDALEKYHGCATCLNKFHHPELRCYARSASGCPFCGILRCSTCTGILTTCRICSTKVCRTHRRTCRTLACSFAVCVMCTAHPHPAHHYVQSNDGFGDRFILCLPP